MKKKSRQAAKQSDLESVRSASAYRGARSFVGMPFIISGVVFVLAAAATLVSAIGTSEGAWMVPLCLVPFISGLFCFGIAALGSTVFDIADCAIREDARARQREAKEAYMAYQAVQKI